MKKSFIILNILLITAAIFFGVKAFYRAASVELEYGEPAEQISKQEASVESEIYQPLRHYNAITDRNLFKTKDAEEVKPEPIKIEEPPKATELKLKLWGTVSGEDRNRAYAVIEDSKERKQNLYREGDNIQNATVKRIERERIILDVSGKEEFLEIEKSLSSKGSMPGAAERAPVSPVATAVTSPEQPPDSELQNIRLERARIEDAMNNVNNLMRQAKIRPHFKNGKPDGLTLSRIRPDSIFIELGLQSGDVIVGVDGKKIESVDDALGFYESLKSSPAVNLEIKRRGQTKIIDYTIE